MNRTYRSFAKINLHLRVVNRRPDGYHEIETVFQSVELADLLSVEAASSGVELEILEGDVPGGQENLAYRAAAEFLNRWVPDGGVRIGLRKRIPVGGGLGGGSSNAATILLALRALFGVPASRTELSPVARELGADVPYFLVGGTALGTGRGDDIEPLLDLPERQVILALPAVQISTAAVFGELTSFLSAERPNSEFDPATMAVDWRIASRGWNDLEPLVLANYSQVQGVYNVLVEAGAAVVRLSGSGATLFALFPDEDEASGLAEKVPPDCRVVRTRTLTRSALERLRVVQ